MIVNLLFQQPVVEHLQRVVFSSTRHAVSQFSVKGVVMDLARI